MLACQEQNENFFCLSPVPDRRSALPFPGQGRRRPGTQGQSRKRFALTFRRALTLPQLHPVVLPHVSHFKHVPLRTSVKFAHSGQASPT
jgi:hypothetical protein